MPDEFPTLEAVAALATLAALVRAIQVASALAELGKLSDEAARALASGDRDTLRRACETSEGLAFSDVATALLDALDSGSPDRQELTRTVEHASKRVARRSRRASTSGALVGVLLVGLLFYAVISRLSPGARGVPSTLFDGLVLLGVLVLAVGIFLNQRLSTETERAAQRMMEAATGETREPA